MTAREYLGKIRKFDEIISQRRRELSDIRRRRCDLRAMDYAGVKVQTSPNAGSSTAQSDRIIDIELEISALIDRFIKERNEIIGMIQNLNHPDYMGVLYRRYVEYKNFDDIADEMALSYVRVTHIHLDALAAFEYRYSDKIRKAEKDDNGRQEYNCSI
jgi:hypothetical protein